VTRRRASGCRALAALLLAIGCGALGGCGHRADDVVVVRFWAMGREGEVVATLLPEFERAHPGIRVEVQPIRLLLGGQPGAQDVAATHLRMPDVREDATGHGDVTRFH